MRKKIRVAGQGGQGAITLAYTIGRALALYANKHVIFTEAYGPEQTGGFAKADLIVDDQEIEYPMVDVPDILVVLSEEGWQMNGNLLAEGGTVIYENFLVNPDTTASTYGIPAVKEAENIGRKVVANVILMGAFQELTGIISKENLEKALLEIIPKGTEELNLKALHRGYELGKEIGGKKNE